MAKSKIERYVVNGATLNCDKGNQSAYFITKVVRGTTIGTGQQGLEYESQKKNVWENFGTCTGSGRTSDQCTKSFKGFWVKTSERAYYSTLTNITPKFQKVYDDYMKLLGELDIEIPREFNSNEMPIHTRDEGFFVLTNPTLSDIADYRSSITEMKNILRPRESDLNNNDTYNSFLINLQLLESQLNSVVAEQEQERIINKSKLITDHSEFGCTCGGVISVVKNEEGQILYYEDIDKVIMNNLRERVRKTIRAHYGYDSATNEQVNNFINPISVGLVDSSLRGEAREKAIEEMKAKLKKIYQPDDIKLYNDLMGEPHSLTEEQAKRIIDSIKIQNLRNEKSAIDAVSNIEKDKNKKEKLEKTSEELDQLLTSIYGNNTAQTAIINSSNTYSDGLSATNVSQIKIKRIIDTKKMAEKAIVHFKVNEDNPNVEEDPFVLLAWLILLKETLDNNNINTQLVAQGDVADGEYEQYGINTFDSGKLSVNEDGTNNFDTYFNTVMGLADTLEQQLPLPKGLREGAEAPYYVSWGYQAVDYADHTGVDINSGHKLGIDVVAVRSGKATTVQNTYVAGVDYGKYIILTTNNNLRYYYAHNQENYISIGDYILAGKMISECGSTGNSSGEHVHFEIRNANGDFNPLSYLPGITLTDVQHQ